MVDSTPLIATPKATNATSYATVARGDTVLLRRLHASAWFKAGNDLPDAADWLVDGGASSGVALVPIDSGRGTWKKGTKFVFLSHATVYEVKADLAGDGDLSISPPLTQALVNDDPLIRLTASVKEAALITATATFDAQLVYRGSRTTTPQSLRCPRTGLYDQDDEALDHDTIPSLLEIATIEFGLVLVERNRISAPKALGLGISEFKLGPMSAKIDSLQVADAIPGHILSLLSPIASLEAEASSGDRIVGVTRA